ncbi:UNVERIFIED_ORG: hypothetical protein GGI63_003426 [Rhizobium esperanzae]
MNEDPAFGADELRAHGDGAPVVAVGCAGNRHFRCDSSHILILQFCHVHFAAEAFRSFLQNEPDYGIGTAERLEAAEAEAVALILYQDRTDPNLLRKICEREQRSWLVAFAMMQETFDSLGGFNSQNLGVGCIDWFAVVGVLVQEEHPDCLSKMPMP